MECDLQMVYYDTLEHLQEKKKELVTPTPRLVTSIYLSPIPLISVINRNPLDVGYDIKRKGFVPLVLHILEDRSAERGCPGWDADFFRRSDLKNHLISSFFPLHQDHSILAPRVTVIKDEHYALLPFPFVLDVIACAPHRAAYHTIEGSLSPDDAEMAYYKIKQIISTAATTGYNALVLRDFGCDKKYRHPPAHVASLFRDAIASFAPNTFKRIVFAVESCNVGIFSEVFR